MEQYGKIVGIVCSIELGNIEQTSAGQTVTKVTRKKSRLATDVETALLAVDTNAINVGCFSGTGSCNKF